MKHDNDSPDVNFNGKKMTAAEFLKDAEPVYRAMFKELAARVGITLDKLNLVPDTGGWRWPYDQYEWGKEEEDDFEKWLVDYLYRHRKELGMSYAKKDYIRRRVVPEWILCFSWRYKNGKE
jgi:hypothetical protein